MTLLLMQKSQIPIIPGAPFGARVDDRGGVSLTLPVNDNLSFEINKISC